MAGFTDQPTLSERGQVDLTLGAQGTRASELPKSYPSHHHEARIFPRQPWFIVISDDVKKDAASNSIQQRGDAEQMKEADVVKLIEDPGQDIERVAQRLEAIGEKKEDFAECLKEHSREVPRLRQRQEAGSMKNEEIAELVRHQGMLIESQAGDIELLQQRLDAKNRTVKELEELVAEHRRKIEQAKQKAAEFKATFEACAVKRREESRTAIEKVVQHSEKPTVEEGIVAEHVAEQAGPPCQTVQTGNSTETKPEELLAMAGTKYIDIRTHDRQPMIYEEGKNNGLMVQDKQHKEVRTKDEDFKRLVGHYRQITEQFAPQLAKCMADKQKLQQDMESFQGGRIAEHNRAIYTTVAQKLQAALESKEVCVKESIVIVLAGATSRWMDMRIDSNKAMEKVGPSCEKLQGAVDSTETEAKNTMESALEKADLMLEQTSEDDNAEQVDEEEWIHVSEIRARTKSDRREWVHVETAE